MSNSATEKDVKSKDEEAGTLDLLDESGGGGDSSSIGKNEPYKDEPLPSYDDKRAEVEGVLFSKSDLANFDAYDHANRKKSTLFGVAALVAVGLTSIVAWKLGTKAVSSNKSASSATKNDRSANDPSSSAQKSGDWWGNSADSSYLDGEIESTSFDSGFAPPANAGDSPVELAFLAPLSEPYLFESDVPFLWMVPQTASLQVRDTIGRCLKHQFSRRYKGEETDSIFSHLLYKVADSFNGSRPPKRGRMFTMLRDPLLRTVDMWYTHKKEEGDIDLETYLKNHFDNNWMTRFLINDFSSPLTQDHLELAKTVLKEKCIIGLDDAKDESFQRFNYYFQWDTLSFDTQRCIDGVLNSPGYEHDVQYPKEYSYEYELLVMRNHMDAYLYRYAVDLFDEQRKTYFKELN